MVGDAAAGEVDGRAQAWLDAHTFRASHEWSDSLQLLTYGLARPAVAPTADVRARFGEEDAAAGLVELAGYDLPAGPWAPGDVLPLTLFWQAGAAVGDDYQVFVHLLDADGRLVAQNDAPPAAGLSPTSSWEPGERVVDAHGVLLWNEAQELPPGVYSLHVGMYLPATGERLVILGDGENDGDNSLFLASIQVVPAKGGE